ncbi:MAG TPA: CocE/NonD family hydrolase [Mycobacteriales bacterium]|nr:CocE/NonD family hydrolase [Mycobacteriales bacterium]
MLRAPSRLLAAGIVCGIAAAIAPLTLAAPASARPQRPAARSATTADTTYGVHKESNVPITMSDGVVLEANVLRPALPDGSVAPGKFPAILVQTPYNKEVPIGEDDYFVQHGYVEVVVDVRGTGSSQGTWDSFGPREQRDYYETAQWLHNLSGTTGDYGTYGPSYLAIDQLYTAAQHPDGLKASFTIVPMGDAYRDVTANGGQVDTGFIPFWLGLVTATGFAPASVSTDPSEALQAAAQHVLGITQFQAPTVLGAVAGEDQGYAGPFYDTRSPLNVIDKITTPTFVAGGEYDLFQRSEPVIYNRLKANHVPTRLVIGPWDHLQGSSGAGLPVDGVQSYDALALKWFDTYVAKKPGATVDDIPPVQVYRLGSGDGSGHYERSKAYPPTDTHYTSLLLGSDGTLGTTRSKDGTATVPAVPVAGVCSKSIDQWTAGLGAAVSNPCTTSNQLNDLLGATFDLPVTGKPLRFAGPSMARLFVSSLLPDASITARLEDVGPTGAATQLAAGWQILSLRKVDAAKSDYADGLMIRPWHPYTKASAEALKAGTVYEIDVEIFPTAAQIATGHTLRLALQTSDSPHLTPNVTQATSLVSPLTLYADPQHPSSIVLGVETATTPQAAVKASHPTKKPTKHPTKQPTVTSPGSLAATGVSALLPLAALALLAAAAVVRRRRSLP